MPADHIPFQGADYSKLGAWLTVVLLSLAGSFFLQGFLSSLLLKLYQLLIQRYGLS